jgi:hypothetical protein
VEATSLGILGGVRVHALVETAEYACHTFPPRVANQEILEHSVFSQSSVGDRKPIFFKSHAVEELQGRRWLASCSLAPRVEDGFTSLSRVKLTPAQEPPSFSISRAGPGRVLFFLLQVSKGVAVQVYLHI